MNKPGVEFSLTYFDNPGLTIPSAFASWVAMSGKIPKFDDDVKIVINLHFLALPEYLSKLRQAAVVLMKQRFEMEKQQTLIDEQKQKEEQAIAEEEKKVSKAFLPFSITLPDVEEPMEPLYHHQFYYL